MFVSKFSHCPLTTTTTSVFTGNGKSFQTTLDSSTFVDGTWATETEYINCANTSYRRRDADRRYGITFTDGSHEFVSRNEYNSMRAKAGLTFVGA